MNQDAVVTKFNEARFHLHHLLQAQKAQDFYATVNAFLSAARSVLYVAQHQFGWKERPRSATFNSAQEFERKQFDYWYESSTSVQAVLAHPLASDRHEVIHRSGQAGFVHIPKPSGGRLAIGHGTPFKQTYTLSRRGIGLPLHDDNSFYYLESSGERHDAMPYAEGFFSLVEACVMDLSKRPWI